MRLFYNVGIYLLDAGLHVAGLFNEKARLWCHGRRGIFRRMAETVQQNAVESVSHEAENVSQINQVRLLRVRIPRRLRTYPIFLPRIR